MPPTLLKCAVPEREPGHFSQLAHSSDLCLSGVVEWAATARRVAPCFYPAPLKPEAGVSGPPAHDFL